MSERSSWSTTNSQVQQRIVRIPRIATYSNKFLSIELTEHALARVRGVLQSTTVAWSAVESRGNVDGHGVMWSAGQRCGVPCITRITWITWITWSAMEYRGVP